MNKKILGIGNAIVDVFAQVEENFLKEKLACKFHEQNIQKAVNI